MKISEIRSNQSYDCEKQIVSHCPLIKKITYLALLTLVTSTLLPTCPVSRSENLLIEANRLEKLQGKQIIIENDPFLMEFQEQVLEVLNSEKSSYKTADYGLHSSPILYDADTDEPIGIIKGQKGQWLVNCEIGDLLAYKLDHDRFTGVPPAFAIHGTDPEGVVVKWIPGTQHIRTQELFNENVEQLQAIIILDLRLGNDDRHRGNLLIGSNGKIYPIDHDRILSQYQQPSRRLAAYGEHPLSETAKNYIQSIDINKDIAVLREHQIDETEIANLVIRTTFLKLAASEDINFEYIENAIKNTKLPTGRVGQFFTNWIYENPLHKILKEIPEPYDENQLKAAFEASFNSYIDWSYPLINKIGRAIYLLF